MVIKEENKLRVSFNIDTVEFVGTKNDDSYEEVFNSFTSAKKIRIVTYSLSSHTGDFRLNKLRNISPDVDIRLIMSIPNLTNVKVGGRTDYSRYTETSLEKIKVIMQTLDVKTLPHSCKIEVCFSNHAKIIGTEDILYVGSANYSKGTIYKYEAGVIIRDKAAIERIYDSFVDKFVTVPFYGDSLDDLRIRVLELYESLENMCCLLSGYENYDYELTYRKESAEEFCKAIKTIIKKVKDALVPVQRYINLCEDISSMVIEIEDYLRLLEKNNGFWDALDSMNEEKSLEALNESYRRDLGLPQIPPAGPEYIDEDTIFKPLYDRAFEEVEAIEEFKKNRNKEEKPKGFIEYWHEAFCGIKEIDEVHDDFDSFMANVHSLITNMLQQAEDEFIEQVKQIGQDSTIEK